MSHVEICNAFNCGFDVQPFKANISFCIFCSFHFVSFLFILLEVTCFSFLSPVVTHAVSLLSHETDAITEEGPGGQGRKRLNEIRADLVTVRPTEGSIRGFGDSRWGVLRLGTQVLVLSGDMETGGSSS